MRIFLFALLLSFCSCRAAKPIVVENYTTDSVIVTETLRDTTVIVEPDSAMIRALVECDSLGQAHIRELLSYKVGTRVKPPKVTLRENVLTATAEVDSLSIFLTYKERYAQNFRQEVVTKIVEINKLTFWQELWIKVGKALSIMAIIILVIKKI